MKRIKPKQARRETLAALETVYRHVLRYEVERTRYGIRVARRKRPKDVERLSYPVMPLASSKDVERAGRVLRDLIRCGDPSKRVLFVWAAQGTQRAREWLRARTKPAVVTPAKRCGNDIENFLLDYVEVPYHLYFLDGDTTVVASGRPGFNAMRYRGPIHPTNLVFHPMPSTIAPKAWKWAGSETPFLRRKEADR